MSILPVSGIVPPTKSAGGLPSTANMAFDANGNLVLNETVSPTTPGADKALVYVQDIASRSMLAYMNVSGASQIVQSHWSTRSISLASAPANGTSMQSVGVTVTATGSGTARLPASTNVFTAARRVGFVSAGSGGSVSGMRSPSPFLWRGNAAGLGGFHFVCRFGWSDASLVTNGRGFVGLSSSSGAPSDVSPAGLTNVIGVGCESAGTNLQLYGADGSTRTPVDLGANFPANTVSTDWYELHLYCVPNGSAVGYRLVRLGTAHVASGLVEFFPSATTFLTPQLWRGNGGTASAVGIDVGHIYTESGL